VLSQLAVHKIQLDHLAGFPLDNLQLLRVERGAVLNPERIYPGSAF